MRPAEIGASAIERLFTRALAAGAATPLALPGGAPLYQAGESADRVYLLRYGRLAASLTDPAGVRRLLGLIHPGETAGEISLLSGETHQATVTALRDSELVALDRKAFLAAAEADGPAMAEIARLIARRTRDVVPGPPPNPPRVFGFVGIHPGLEAGVLARRLVARLARWGWSAAAVSAERLGEPLEWFSRLEADHDFVFYVAEAEEADWTESLARQIDHLILIADARAEPTVTEAAARAAARLGARADLALLHPVNAAFPDGAAAFEARLDPGRILHLRRGHQADLERLGRHVSGQAVGLVLSGGAARAYAHLGVLAALEESRTPIDFLAGVSMGAIIAAAEAMGWPRAEMAKRIRKAFVETSPVDDIAFPLIAMSRGGKVRQRLEEHFGDRLIEDLWRPFFCLSTNLTTGTWKLHRRGRLSEALRASVALPGLLPPVVQNGEVLVDGAVIKNFPVDLMRAFHAGPIVGVDVTIGRSLDAKELAGGRLSLWRWLLAGRWRAGPPIVSILMRAGTVGAERDLAAARAAADLLILPQVEGIEMRDFKAFGPAVAAGQEAARIALSRLDGPVTQLRLRPATKPWKTA